MTFFASVLAGKRVELLKEAVPNTTRVGVLANPNHAGESLEFRETETAAKAMSVSLQRHTAQVANDFAGAFDAIAKQRATAIITFPDALMLAHRKEIAEFSVKLRLASVGGWSQFADAGGLMTYGPNLSDSFRRVALYVDKIVKGAKPEDLPVEQPTSKLVHNLKTAKPNRRDDTTEGLGKSGQGDQMRLRRGVDQSGLAAMLLSFSFSTEAQQPTNMHWVRNLLESSSAAAVRHPASRHFGKACVS